MTNIDQFESVFKSADKTPFEPEQIQLQSLVVVTDLDENGAQQFSDQVQRFLHQQQDCQWTLFRGDSYDSVGQLLELIDSTQPDLIATYRNLHTPATEYPYSLGVFVDVLTQVTTAPVLLMPHPVRMVGQSVTAPTAVMAITDHLTGDHHLVSMAARLTDSGGTLLLTHVEDELVFERYAETIGKIPSIDTDEACEAIRAQLLKEPHDFIRSCREVLQELGMPFEVAEIVVMGHRLSDYQRLIEEHQVRLVVLNTKDEDQLAMHGTAYPIAVELRDTPLLLL